METILIWIITSALLMALVLKKFNHKAFMVLSIGQFVSILSYIAYNYIQAGVIELNIYISHIPYFIIAVLFLLKLFFTIKLKFRMRAIRKAVKLRKINQELKNN